MKGTAVPEDRRGPILEAWRRRIFKTYAGPTADFLAKGGDRFRNPAADAIRRGTEETLAAFFAKAPREELARALDGIVRLRAVQDFPPSGAVGFVFALKDAVREAAGADAAAALAGRIDDLALVAFDVYAACRQRIADIRVAEAKARLGQLLKRAERKVGA